MRPLLETEKNYLTCTILMMICAIGLYFLDKPKIAIFSGVCGVIFFIIMIVMYINFNIHDTRTDEQKKRAKEDKKALEKEMKEQRFRNAGKLKDDPKKKEDEKSDKKEKEASTVNEKEEK